MKSNSPELTNSEWDIMNVVWEKAPCTAGTVQEALESSKGWAYSTVKTTMDRMCKKGFLKITRIRNLQLFHPTIEPETARRRELMRAVRRAFDGALTPALHLLMEEGELSAQELQELKIMIQEAEKRESNPS